MTCSFKGNNTFSSLRRFSHITDAAVVVQCTKSKNVSVALQTKVGGMGKHEKISSKWSILYSFVYLQWCRVLFVARLACWMYFEEKNHHIAVYPCCEKGPTVSEKPRGRGGGQLFLVRDPQKVCLACALYSSKSRDLSGSCAIYGLILWRLVVGPFVHYKCHQPWLPRDTF